MLGRLARGAFLGASRTSAQLLRGTDVAAAALTAPLRLAVPTIYSTGDALAASSSAAAAATHEATAARETAVALLPALTAAWTLSQGISDLVPSILLVGKKSHRGKNKRMPKKANHGALPCSHVMRRRRAAALGRNKANHHK